MEKEKCNCESNEKTPCNNEKCDCNNTCEKPNDDVVCKDGVCEVKKKEKKKMFKKNDEKLKEYEAKIQDLENKLLMQSADSINYRKRKDEEVARMLKFCNEDLIKQMLPILDNFERAIKLDDDNLDDEVSKFLEGFKMIYCNMQSIMEKFDVKPIDGANKPFDPIYHNAIMVEKKDDVEPGMVLEVLQKGYIYKEKVIRPAMVKVSE